MQLPNPKKPGSKAHARYEKYKTATNYKEYRALGGTARDWKHDNNKKFVKFGEVL